jgi:protocatechuate 3,4-dioxygenase beta subunit
MNRNKFLALTSMSAFSISVLGKVTKERGDFVGDCDTTNDILGSFYRADAPTRYDMTFENLTGTVVELKGKVCQSDCVTPIENALVEIWHRDMEGVYDNETKYFRHRAKCLTNEKGEYHFKTILPGKYLNGRLYRSAHIHF